MRLLLALLLAASAAHTAAQTVILNSFRFAGGGGSPSFTIVQTEGEREDTSDTTISCVVEGVTAGSLIAVYVTYEGTATTVTVSDGSAYTARTHHTATAAGSDLHGQWHYILSSGSGDRTITATLAAARGFKAIMAVVATYVGTASYDTEPTGGGTSGNSTAINSGTMTTTGAVELVLGGYGPYSANTVATPLINAVAADVGRASDDDTTSPFTAGQSVIWARVVSGTFTGAATATLGGSDVWMCGGIAFKTQ